LVACLGQGKQKLKAVNGDGSENLLNPPAVDGLKTISTACHRNWVTFFMQIELEQQLPAKLSHCLSATVAIKSKTSIVYASNSV